MKKSTCLKCRREFKSKTDKKKHKKEYPNGSCIKEMETEKKIERKSPIQKVERIVIPKEQAKIEWKKYNQLLKKRKDKHLRILKESMYHAKQGKELINIYEAIKKAGLNKNNQPRLAIARADIKEVIFEKRDTSSGKYIMGKGWNRPVSDHRTDVELPQKSFKIDNWEKIINSDGTASWQIKNKEIQTKVPLIPPDLMPEGDLKNYYIFWEVKTWEELPEVKDPFLLKRISENMFVILGVWDITELERAIMEGLK